MVQRHCSNNHKILTVIILILLLSSIPAKVNAQYEEKLLKAVYIERITRFIDWPDNHVSPDKDYFYFGVLGDDEFFRIVRQVFKSQLVKDKKVIVIILNDPGNIKDCDLCYIAPGNENIMVDVMKKANESGVLVCTDSWKNEKTGIHINFFVEANKLRFELNKKALDSGRFKVSSVLLSNARINTM